MNRKSILVVTLLALSLNASLALAENYLPGQSIKQSDTVLTKLGKAFLPGLRRSSDDTYTNAFLPSAQSYVFADEIGQRQKDGLVQPQYSNSGQAPVGNLFSLKF